MAQLCGGVAQQNWIYYISQMATNKNALIRYKVLDKCFRNTGRKYFINDLIEECNRVLGEIDLDFTGISRRQIFDDMLFMESGEGWSVDLGKFRDGKKVYYRYQDTSFSINNMPLNELEVSQLQSAIDILSQFKGMPQFEWIHEMVPKLQQGARTEQKGTIIDFDSNIYLKGIERLGELYNAILYKKVLKVSYRPFGEEKPFDVTIHPYYLKQYNNRWFLFGYNPEREKYDWNLAIDRIVNVLEIKGKYEKNTKIDWSEYFEDMIGVTKPEGGELENVTLHFFGRTAKYIESKPLHGSQKARWIENDTLEVNLQVLVNYELERLILSYCDNVKVASPMNLKSQIKQRLTEAIKKF
jgi:predicted DNA-binding transcriptional regulator YafY